MADYLTPIRIAIFSRLPRSILAAISYVIAWPLFVIIQIIYKGRNDNNIPARKWLRLPYFEYFTYTSQLSYVELVSVIFDHLVPELTTYIRREEFESWFHGANLVEVNISSRKDMSWRGNGIRKLIT